MAVGTVDAANNPSAGTATSFVVIVGACGSGEEKNRNEWSPAILEAASIARSFADASRATALRICSPSNASMAARHRVSRTDPKEPQRPNTLSLHWQSAVEDL